MSAAALGFPFTWAQWKELERQAMIYKYMAASVPVPSHLLLPFTRNFSADSSASHLSTLGSTSGSILSLRFSKNGDSEPGRCKRTDGKKWRCSRDVAPHQKYCERHMNRGRPRSRKPVEVNTNNNKKTRILPTPTVPGNGSAIIPPNETTLPKTIRHVHDVSYKEPNRGLDWMVEGQMDPSEQQWHHLMQTSASVFQEESLNLGSYTNFGGSDDVQQNGECNLFLNPDLVSLGTLTPRGFIDAWSKENPSVDHHESSVLSHGNLSPSSLTLSMAMAVGNALNDDPKAHVSSWLSPDSWVPCTGGGPLAEVLRPSTAAMGSNPVSPYAAAAGDAISPPTTTVSSPSEVLHRTMLSLSDSSVCNSPTLAASTATPEIVAFQWLG